MSFTLWIQWHDRDDFMPYQLHSDEAEEFADLDEAISFGTGLMLLEREMDTVEVRERDTVKRRLRRTPSGGVLSMRPQWT